MYYNHNLLRKLSISVSQVGISFFDDKVYRNPPNGSPLFSEHVHSDLNDAIDRLVIPGGFKQQTTPLIGEILNNHFDGNYEYDLCIDWSRKK